MARLLFPAALLGLLVLGSAGTARADTGLLALEIGAATVEEGGEASLRPSARAGLAIEMLGLLALGAFVQGTATELPFEGPAFGGGLQVLIRPTIPGTGVHPHLEASASRLQIPTTTQGRVDAWGTSVGAGLGVDASPGVSLEGRVRRHWYHGIDRRMDVGDSAWSVTGGVAFHL